MSQQVAQHGDEALALGGVLGGEQLLALVDGDQHRGPRGWSGILGGEAARLRDELCGLAHEAGQLRGSGERVSRHQLGIDRAGRAPDAMPSEPVLQALAQALRPGNHALGRAHDRQRHELGGARQLRPEPGAQEARLTGAGGRLDHHQARAAAMAHLAQVADTAHDIGLAAEEDAGGQLVEGIEARVGLRVGALLRRPGEAVGRMPPVDQLGVDRLQRQSVEIHEVPASLMLDLDALLQRVDGQVHYLAVHPRLEARIIELHVAQDGDDHVLAVVLGAAHLALAFVAVERLGRGEEQQRIAGDVGLDQRLAPLLAGLHVVQVDEDVILPPALCHQPALECECLDVVLAGVRNE